MTSFSNKTAEFYTGDEWRGFSIGHPGGITTTRKLLEMSGVRPGARLLDLCCGIGDSVALCQRLGIIATGIDRPEVIQYSRSKYQTLEFIDWSSSDNGLTPPLPFASRHFDAVLCECSFSLLPDQAYVLREIKRILVPQGKWLVSDLYGDEPPSFRCFDCLWWEDATSSLISFAAQWLWKTGKRFHCACDPKHLKYFLGVYGLSISHA